MKHGDFVKEQFKLYPFNVTRKCINYQRWKLWIKTQPNFIRRYWKILLLKDCRRINRFLFPIFCNSEIDPEWIYSLCILNTDTFYKICKKLKRHIKVDALKFYKKIIYKRKFRFTDIAHRTII